VNLDRTGVVRRFKDQKEKALAARDREPRGQLAAELLRFLVVLSTGFIDALSISLYLLSLATPYQNGN
jgi:hypothetical protein